MFPEKASHKAHRAALKKEKRRRRRQDEARSRESAAPAEEDASAEEQALAERLAEQERQRLHDEWLQREREAQEDFRRKEREEEAARQQKAEEERQLRDRREEERRRERGEQLQRLQEQRDREQAVQRLLDGAQSEGPWQNPEPPPSFRRQKHRASCPFYSKTGACRFGDRCSRKHDFPTSSPTLLVKSMFTTFGMEQSRRDDYDSDASLEYSEEETYQQFLDFYHDVLPEFRNVGKVVQFKVSCNLEPHLRGNVYVQYRSEEECQAALGLFNGRWYAGRQLQCEFCPVTQWKTAICGLFERQQCPRGKHCNFLHVFRNPDGELRDARRDASLSPNWTGFSCGKSSERREGRDHHVDYYSRPRRSRPRPYHFSKKNENSDRKSSHRWEKSHKQAAKSRERHSSSRERNKD